MTTRSRRIGGIVLLVLAALLVPVAVIATWTARTVTDTDAFVSRVAPVAATPEVQALIEQEMTEQITTAVIDDRAAPLVIFCRSDCWMSWNAARRAVALGYSGIQWFPGGIEGWQAAGGAPLVKATPADP